MTVVSIILMVIAAMVGLFLGMFLNDGLEKHHR